MLRALDIAISQLGVQEATGHNDGIPATRYMRGDKLAWCAGFCLYCNDVSDDENVALTTKDHYTMRSVSGFIAEAKRRKFFVSPTAAPLPNDFIFFGNTDSDVGVRGSHIGIVESVDTAARRITTIEGNYGNKVARVAHRLGDRTIVGFGRPSLI
jgi:hypothetical protein